MSKMAPFSLLLSQPTLMASSSGVKRWSKVQERLWAGSDYYCIFPSAW